MIFINEPRPVSLADYEFAIARMTRRVAALPNLRALYQIGGLSAPGISDIDMVAVFDDEARCVQDPRKRLASVDRYLFVHRLFGTSVSHFAESGDYTFFHNFRLLAGEDLYRGAPRPQPGDAVMKRQWAREFLVRMLVNLAVEREFGICKVRSLLLQARALIYDLEFLEADAPALMGHLHQIMRWRKNWFSQRPPNREIRYLFLALWKTLTRFLQDQLTSEPLFLPERARHCLGRNIILRRCGQIGARARGLKFTKLGLPLPDTLARRLMSVQHRLNRFVVTLPFSSDNIPGIVAASFDHTAGVMAYSRRCLPHFMPLTSSLVLTS